MYKDSTTTVRVDGQDHRLTQILYKHGWEKQRILDLFRVIDWMMYLPEQFSKKLWQNIDEFEGAQKMRYISTVERFIIERKKSRAGKKAARKASNSAAKKIKSVR